MNDLTKVNKRKLTPNNNLFIQYQVETKYMFPWSSYDYTPTQPEEEVKTFNHNKINIKQKEKPHSIFNVPIGYHENV